MKKSHKVYLWASMFLIIPTIISVFIIIFNPFESEKHDPKDHFVPGKYIYIGLSGTLVKEDNCYVLKQEGKVKARFYNLQSSWALKDTLKVEVTIHGVEGE